MTARIRSVRLTRRQVTGLVGAVVVALTVAVAVLSARTADLTGLQRSVYAQGGFAGVPSIADVKAKVTLDFLADHPAVPDYEFSARWHGFWYMPEAQVIDVHGAGDDRLDIWLNGELVIRRTPPADMHMLVRTVTLDAGLHEILIEYQQHGGEHALSVGWAPRGSRFRPFAPHRLFPEQPTLADVRLARHLVWLEPIILLAWVTVVLGGGFLVSRAWINRGRCEPATSHGGWETAVRAVLVAGVVAVAVRAVFARLPGWNPESLWFDDLVYGAIIRADFWSMITIPIHVAPGLFVIWRALYALFPDPEGALQLLPFTCGIAAIPVMALVVRTLTRDDGLALLAAAATALNPLLAHYTVFVHQYPFDFLATALFLLGATGLSSARMEIEARRFGWVALGGGLATFFSVPSVFVSFPLVHLGAVSAVYSGHPDRRRTVTVLLSVAAYDVAVFIAYLFMSGRTNEQLRNGFSAGFMPLDSVGAAWEFVVVNVRRLLDMSLPDLNMPPWPLPFVGLGVVWLLARRSTRVIGLAILGAYGGFAVASALRVYPLGTGRPDIFAFPLAILLFAAGVHFMTASLPGLRLVRLAFSLALAALAIVRPIHVEYREDVGYASSLVDHLAARVRADDGMILMPGSEFLTAFYGPWPFTISAGDDYANATRVTLSREATLHLRGAGGDRQHIRQYLSSRPDRIWVVTFWRGKFNVSHALEQHGYTIHEIEARPPGGLYLALDLSPPPVDGESALPAGGGPTVP